MDTLAFLTEIFRYSNHNIYLWTSPGKRTRAFTTDELAQMAEAAKRLSAARQNVFFGVGTTTKRLGEYGRPKNEEITGLSAFWVDVDVAGDAHAAQNLPPDVMAAQELLPAAPAPSIVVHSGHGLHAYWLLREEWPLDTPQERRQAAAVLRRLQGVVRQSAKARGWHIDSVADLTRVLRLPGTWNFKQPDAPALCQVIAAADLRYNVSDFDGLPETGAAPAASAIRPDGFERRPTDGPADYMLQNCRFLQHWQLNYKTLPEPVWMAACTNLIRGVGGEEIAVAAVKDWLGEKYSEDATLKKIEHWFNGAHPTTCQYIQTELRFAECAACGVQSPCCWSLEAAPRSVAVLRAITQPNVDNVFVPETLGALALLEHANIGEYEKFRAKCQGYVNLNNLSKAVREQRKKNSGLSVVAGGAATLRPGQKLGEITTCQSVPDTPLNLAIPAGFAYGPNGVDQIKTTADGAETRYNAAGAPVIISERVYNVDAKTEKVELTFRYFGKWPRVLRKRSDVFSARNIIALTDYGLSASSESAKYLVKYLQALEAANPDAIPLKHAVSKIGWRESSLTDFVIPGTEKYRIDMEDEGEVTEAFTIRGDFAAWKKTAAQIRRQPFARFILAAAFAAPLLKIFKNRNFMIYFWGTSGGGKTASQVFALTVWGSPARLMKSFYGTQNGIEKALAFSNDFPMVINEKQVMNGRDKQDLFEQIVYMLEGGRGKLRASKTGLQKTSTWRSIGMASGEEPLSRENSIQGVKTRLLELNVYPVIDNDEFAKSIYALAEEHHGHAGPAFIGRLVEEDKNDYREIGAARAALVKKLKQGFPEHFGIHIDNVALVAIADYLYSMWLLDTPAKQAEQAAYEMACTIMRELPTERQISDVERGWDFVQEWLASNSGRIEKPHCETKVTPTVGFTKDDYICIYPKDMIKALQDAGFSAEKMLREFANKERIVSTMDKHGKKRYRIAERFKGGRPPVIKIPLGDNQNIFEGV